MPSALLSPSVDVCRWICDFVLEDYRGRGRYTDCLLLCGRDQNAALKCHSLVLATISPWLGHLIRDQEERILHFFDLSTTELKVFLDEVYHGFSSSVAEVKIEVSENVSQALGMKLALKDLEYNCDSSFLADAAMKTEEPLAQKEEEESDADREEVVAATHEQSQPVKRKRGRPSIPYFDNEIRSKKLKIDASSNAMGDGSSDLDGMMRLGEGTLPEVPVIFQDWAAQRVLPFLQPKSYFRAIFGILGETSCCVHVTPLAWSDPSEVDIPTQFKRTISAYKAVFGFSQAEMTNNSILCHKQNIITGNFRKRKLDEVFKTFCQKDSADIQAGLERHNDLISTFEVTTDPAASNTPGLNSELVNLKLVNSSLADPPFIGVIVVAWRKSGVRCFPMVLNLEDRANASDLCLKALFDVWCTSEKKLPVTDYLKTVYEEISRHYIAREAFLKLCSETVPEKQCPECGMVFVYLTKKDKHKFKSHIDVHEREKFTCDCIISFADANEKRRHILLLHSNGKYVKCEQCAYIGSRKQVKTHSQSNHKSHVCDVCGKTVPTRAALSVHALDHKVYNCEICNIILRGRHKHARHMDTVHSGTWTCDQCGSAFKSKHYLQKHTLTMHQKDEDKPFRCDDCGKGFLGSNALKTHQMNVHIKARPYVCRYGCGAAYNDTSNRGHHERKKHGGTFTQIKT